jgi:hypothetical protein
MNAAAILFNQVNPMFVFAVRGLASLDRAQKKAEMLRHRSAFRVTLEAAGVDLSNLADEPRGAARGSLVCWYDMTGEALRLFFVSDDALDETTEQALELLSGTIIGDWENHPIEDVDASIRMMALMGTGGQTAEALFEAHVVPNADRYDDDFPAPTVEDLEELWCTWRAHYLGGSTAAPEDVDAWIMRTYAFAI